MAVNVFDWQQVDDRKEQQQYVEENNNNNREKSNRRVGVTRTTEQRTICV